jgi:3-hydroxyisobutyrate dehydrogenase-like beta-hydroxyacid dehydrogenase
MSKNTVPVIGFVGLGVMGGPMCRNVALKHSGDVIAFDMNPAAFAALEGTKARLARALGEVAEQADLVFLSLPGAQQVEQAVIEVVDRNIDLPAPPGASSKA